MNGLLRLLLYWRDDTGRWVPTGWGTRLTLAAGFVMLSWILWQGITEVRRGSKDGWRTISWATFGSVIWVLFIASHAYAPWSPMSIGIAVVTAAAGIAWAVVGFRKGYPLRGDEQAETEAAHEAGGDGAAGEASADQEPQAESPTVYTGPSAFREVGHYLGVEVAAALSVAVAAGWWSGLLGYLWAPIAGVALLLVLAGRGVIREARWDELGVEFRWLYGRPTVYLWDELQKLARPNRWRQAEGTGLLLFTRRGEMIEIKSGGENFSTFSDALMAKLPLENQ